MLFSQVCDTSHQVAATPKRSVKVDLLASLLRVVERGEIETVVGFLVGAARQGRIGVGWAQLRQAPAPASTASLTVGRVDGMLDALAGVGGVGSVAERRHLLHGVLADATEDEQRFLIPLIGGELRQGASAGVMASAIAKAGGVPLALVRRAAMLTGDLGRAASTALTDGVAGLSAVTLTPSHAVEPMLAASSADVGSALGQTGMASVEWKLDGARVQAHRRAGEVRLFTRNLNEITDRLGGVIDVVAALPGGDLVLDGEVLAVGEDDTPRPFQDTMGDFGADGAGGRGVALRPFFFDVLHVDDTTIIDEPLGQRREVLRELVPATARLPSIETVSEEEAGAFLDRAVTAGHEGVMIKALDSTYDAGRRGGAWRKVKPVYTFDLVVLAAEWGHGRRTGWLSNLHLGARGDDGTFVMVGKTFKGLTDELLTWQTDALSALTVGTDGHVVHVRPDLVVEIAIDGVQRSTRYAGGVALRFARVRRYRLDKRAVDADTVDAVRALLR